MANLADKPDWAPSVWHDNCGNLYAQFGQVVHKFTRTEGGLSKLLKIIPTITTQPGYVKGRSIADQVLKNPVRIAKKSKTRKKALHLLGGERRSRLQDLIDKAEQQGKLEEKPRGKAQKIQTR